MNSSKQKLNLVQLYRPIGLQAVLAAALMMKEREVIGIRVHDQPDLSRKSLASGGQHD